jgi:hypothetical protein
MDRRTYGNECDLYGRDLLTGEEFPLAVGPNYQWWPDISGNTVVWTDTDAVNSTGRVWGATLNAPVVPTGPVVVSEPFLIAGDEAGGGRVSGDIVAYVDWSRGSGDYDIYGYDLTTRTRFPICVGQPGERRFLAIDGDLLVWLDARRGINSLSESGDLYAYDLSDPGEQLICAIPPSRSYGPMFPLALSGNIVAWADCRNLYDGGTSAEDIYGYDLAGGGEFPICLEPGRQANPDIDGDSVVWCNLPEGSVSSYDLATTRKDVLVAACGAELHPAVTADRLVWDAPAQDGAGDTDIYTLVEFADVPALHWAFGPIAACHAAGIVTGYGEIYAPSGYVDRAQMAVFVARAVASGEAGVPAGPTTPSFADVPAGYWAYKYVEYALAQNIVTGYESNLYEPTWNVTRGQMAVFIARALVAPAGEAAVSAGPVEPTFPDVTSSNGWSWCYNHIEFIAARYVTHGYGGLYHPEYLCSRDQMAVYVQRAWGLTM